MESARDVANAGPLYCPEETPTAATLLTPNPPRLLGQDRITPARRAASAGQYRLMHRDRTAPARM
jgi:hypothetical protein